MYWCTLGFSWELLTKRVLDLYRDYPYRKLPIANLPKDPQPGALFRLHASTMAIADAYKAPAGRMLLSPQFVPREGSAGGSTDGYVVCTVISDDTSWSGSSGDEIWIFDAKNLAQGPLCRLGHPLLDMPFTLHSTWMKEIAPRTATYKIPAQADFADGLKSQPSDVQQLFASEVFPHFA